MNDFELVEAWKAGDRTAGDTLLRRHIPALRRFFANKVGDERDDLVQRTVLGLLKSKDGFAARSSFRTFLFVVAKRQLYRHYERRADPREDWASLMTVEGLSETPSQVVARHEQQRWLLAALRRLPVELQVAIELHYFEGLATAELADALDIPQGTAKSRLRRGREALDTHLRRLAHTRAAEETMATLEDWMQRIRASIDAEPGPSEKR